jgi:pyridoxamine 5'-phosphate oxidase
MSENIADIRKDYKMQSLLEGDISQDPFTQFGNWWNEAVKSDIEEVNAMTLATSTPSGTPSARIVLLKGYTNEGFKFFTNYQSHKAKEIEQNPQVALVFFWKELERQIRIEGTAEKVSPGESDEYFDSRPLKSKIGAWASPQSKPVDNRLWIEDRFEEFSDKFIEEVVPRPPHWGGYIVKPSLFEFWQGRRSRLHDRIQYTKEEIGWKIERLAP